MKLVIDRFEETIVVCEKEDREMLDLPRELFPPESREGDIVYYEDGVIRLDQEATLSAKESAEMRFGKLIKK